MSGGFSVGGLVTGLDSNTIISQLLAVERKPETRMKERISGLQKQQSAIRDLRTQLLALRTRVQDFRLNSVFNRYKGVSSDDTVAAAEVNGSPVVGAYKIDVTRLASATVATSGEAIGHAIDPSAALNASGLATAVTGGTFTINGVEFTVDPETQSLNDVIAAINGSAAGVTARYDVASDTVTLANAVAGDTSLINLGDANDDSNLLDVLALTAATQATDGRGSTAATGTRNLGAVDASANLRDVAFKAGAVTAGTFSINGVSFAVDPATDSLADVLQRINASGAQVTASYDTATDTVRVVSKVLGSRTVRFSGGTSNFLDATNLSAAAQVAGQDAQFSIDGGAVQTRNSNEVSDAIGGVTLHLLSEGQTTVTISSDDDAMVEKVQGFIDDFNKSVSQIHDLVKAGGVAEGDGSLRIIDDFLKNTVFSQVEGLSGGVRSLADLGITTGEGFDAEAVLQLHLDETKFRDALRTGRADVASVFANDAKNGVADAIYSYLDGVTATTGFLNDRAKANGTIDSQIRSYNDQIARLEARVLRLQTRLKAQFAQLEQLSASYQSQNAALTSLAGLTYSK